MLGRYGYIVILEAGDNLYDLECVGLNREDCGLLGSMPEYVETLQLGDMTVYSIVVMYTNDFIMTFFMNPMGDKCCSTVGATHHSG
ncbi:MULTISPECIES: hypothetical protein [Paenibacillus]|uniref:Uncharacterized protein n=1 Tax=Paenibacillus urinalis TaxID=521520 RepID=A0AAX3N1X9_9BACL|nr:MULTISPECIES: hypothetical protein [Paenibacillus]WDH82642.1 hypothetical protein PUW23_24905 [Paenibacillus urinalis]